jgi:amidase
MTADLHYSGLVDVGRKIQARELSPLEATKAMLERIEKLDGKLKSFAYVMADSALAAAAAAEQEITSGKIKGPLHGVPVAVKDLCWVKGAPAAHGMTIHRDFRPTEDATVVARLKDAGAIILGKLQQTEGAYADHHQDRSAEKSLERRSVAWRIFEWLRRRHRGGPLLRFARH